MDSATQDAQMIHWIVSALLGSPIILVLISTSLDICVQKGTFRNKCLTGLKRTRKTQATLLAVLQSFSLLRNVKKLMWNESTDGKMTFLHGMRYYTIAWIVWVHCYMNEPSLFGGASEFLNFARSFWFQIIANAYLSIDTLMLISGLLVAYLSLHKMEQQNGRISYIAFYLHRIFRLTPPYLFILGLYVMLPYLGSGPQWQDSMKWYCIDNCRRTWWKNMLYINNFFYSEDSCSVHFWYMGTLFQLFIISPPLLSALYRKPFLGISILVFLTLVCMTCSGVLRFLWDYPPVTLIRPIELAELRNYQLYLYHLPYNHGVPYFLGMLLGYCLYRMEGIRVNQMVTCFGWIISATLCLLAIYGVYPWNKGVNVHQKWAVVYAVFGRAAWSIGIAWIIFICFTENGGAVNAFLSCKTMIPLTRLSYCVYLIHLIFIALFRAHLRMVEHLTHVNILYLFSAVMFLSHLSAIVCTLVFEYPFQALQKLLQTKVEETSKTTMMSKTDPSESVQMKQIPQLLKVIRSYQE